MRRALGAVVLAAAAFWLGRATAPEAAAVAPAPVVVTAAVPSAGDPDEVRRLRAQVAELTARTRAERSTADQAVQTVQRLAEEKAVAEARAQAANVPPGAERPVPFPPDAPPQFQPERFRAVAEAVAAQCGLGVRLADVDCSEYPCLAFYRRGEGPQASTLSPGECGPWRDAFGDLTTASVAYEPDGGLGSLAWMPVPPGPERRAALFRTRGRVERWRERAP